MYLIPPCKKIHQLRSAFIQISPTTNYLHSSWWVFGLNSSHLVNFYKER